MPAANAEAVSPSSRLRPTSTAGSSPLQLPIDSDGVEGPTSLGLSVDLISSSCPSPLYFRADAAFANSELYELLEAEDIGYAIRLPVNRVLVARRGPNPPLAYGPVASSARICRRKRVRIDRAPSRAHPARCRWGDSEIPAAQAEPLQGSTLPPWGNYPCMISYSS